MPSKSPPSPKPTTTEAKGNRLLPASRASLTSLRPYPSDPPVTPRCSDRSRPGSRRNRGRPHRCRASRRCQRRSLHRPVPVPPDQLGRGDLHAHRRKPARDELEVVARCGAGRRTTTGHPSIGPGHQDIPAGRSVKPRPRAPARDAGARRRPPRRRSSPGPRPRPPRDRGHRATRPRDRADGIRARGVPAPRTMCPWWP